MARAPRRGHAARAVQQEQRGGRRRDLPRAPGHAALRLDRFRGARASTGTSKGANLAALAEELDLGLDTLHPGGRQPQGVRRSAGRRPRRCWRLPCPPRAEEIPEFLEHVWAFDRARVTEEDRRRAELYAQRAERARAERGAGQPGGVPRRARSWTCASRPWSPRKWTRVAQLTQRTNQMNATCVRRTAAEIAAPAHRRGVPDRHRDATASAATASPASMIFRRRPAALVVDTFLLSCRALGRGVEHRMVARLGEIALRTRPGQRVEIPFVAAQRNRPALLFLESLGARRTPDGVFRSPRRAKPPPCVYHPVAGAPARRAAPRGPERAARAPRATTRASPTELRNPAADAGADARAARAAHRRPRACDPPRTALERDLARLWSELLNIASRRRPRQFLRTRRPLAARRATALARAAGSAAWSSRSKWSTPASSPWRNWPRRSS